MTPRRSRLAATWPVMLAEAGAAVVLIVVLTAAGLLGWRVYRMALRPLTADLPPLVGYDSRGLPPDPHRVQKVWDHLGAAATFIGAGQREPAIEQLLAVLKLDPGHTEARRMLAELGYLMPPLPTPPHG